MRYSAIDFRAWCMKNVSCKITRFLLKNFFFQLNKVSLFTSPHFSFAVVASALIAVEKHYFVDGMF